jgi:hypothetical protein
MQAILSIGGAGDGGDATDLLLEAVGGGFEAPCAADEPPPRLVLRSDESHVRLMAMEGLYQLCTDSPAARRRARHYQAAVRAAAAAIVGADAAAPPTEEVACFLKFVAYGFWAGGARECDTRSATVAEREAELPLREAVDALPSLIRVALRLAAAPSAKAAVHALESLAMVLTCPPFMERAAGG